MPSSRKNSADLLDRLVELRRGLKGPGDEAPDGGEPLAPDTGILGRFRRLILGSSGTRAPQAENRAPSREQPSADAPENPALREFVSTTRLPAADTPRREFGGAKKAPASRERASSGPPPWSIDAESLTFRKGFLKILNPGRSPRPVPFEDAGAGSPEGTPSIDGEAPAELEKAPVLTGARSRPLRARHRIPPLEEPQERQETAEPEVTKEPSSFDTLARVADGDDGSVGDDGGSGAHPSGSSPDATLGVVDAGSGSYTRPDGMVVYGKSREDDDRAPEQTEAGEVRSRRRRRRRGKRAKLARDVFREVTQRDSTRTSSAPRSGEGVEPDAAPEPRQEAEEDRSAEDTVRDRASAPALAASEIGDPIEEHGAARPVDVGPRLPVRRRVAGPGRPPVRLRDRVRSRAVVTCSAVRRSLEAVLGAELVKACRKSLEVSVGTLVVAAAVGVVVVTLGFLATSRGGGPLTTPSAGRTMPFSELNLPDIVAGGNARLLELRNVVHANGAAPGEPDPRDVPAAGEGSYYIQIQAFQDLTHPHFSLFVGYLNKLGYDNIYKFPMGRNSERGEPYYYLRLGPYQSEDDAKSQCELFIRRARAQPFGHGMDLENSFPRQLGPRTLQMGSRVRN